MGWVTTRRMRGLAAEAGIWVTLLTLAALLAASHSPPPAAWLGIALLALGRDPGARRPLAALAVCSGAVLVAFAIRHLGPGWVAPAVLLAAVAAALAVPDLDRRRGDPALGPLLVALSALGVYFTVPDTEEAVVLMAVAVPVAVLALPFGVRLGPHGAAAVGGLLVWVVAVGGRGREGAVVGGLACLGLLLGEPVAAWMRWRLGLGLRAGLRTWPAVLVYGSAVHAAAVLIASRWAGLHRQAAAALAIAAPTLVAATVLALALTAGDDASGRAARRPPATPRARRAP